MLTLERATQNLLKQPTRAKSHLKWAQKILIEYKSTYFNGF
jgi:hypothetical protein